MARLHPLSPSWLETLPLAEPVGVGIAGGGRVLLLGQSKHRREAPADVPSKGEQPQPSHVTECHPPTAAPDPKGSLSSCQAWSPRPP